MDSPQKKAIFASVKHLLLPLSAATATTALAFMPIAVGEGPSNEFVGGMAKTLIMAVTSSLFFVFNDSSANLALSREDAFI